MRRGFTILELLVASLLLGMLMTILTMIFSQSSIAWRTGVAGVADMNGVRNDISGIQYKADNGYPDESGNLKRVGSVFTETGALLGKKEDYLGDFSGQGVSEVKDPRQTTTWDGSYGLVKDLGSTSTEGAKNYVINVMSSGPDRKMDTYDDIWSFPDDEWWK